MLKSRKVIILCVSVILAIAVIAVKGVHLGIDFKGGAALVFSFDRDLNTDEMKDAAKIIEHRLNWTGLQSIHVKSWGKKYIIIELAEENKDRIDEIKKAVLRQGFFEATVDGNVVLTGKDILSVRYDYSILPKKTGVSWDLPFRLSPEGMKKFYRGVYGKCDPECPRIYMYIDRPSGWAVVGEKTDKIICNGEELPLEEAILNSGVKVYSENNIQNIEENKVIIGKSIRNLIKGHKTVRVVDDKNLDEFWCNALGIRSTAIINEELTRVKNISSASPNLTIRGWAKNKEEALREITELRILLESGALPAGIMLVSEYRIPAVYGEQLFLTFIAALVIAMVTISLYLGMRYRNIKLSIPVAITIFSEIIIIFAIATLINWKIDIPSMIGILAAVGTGVDNQIIIMDEILEGRREDKKVEGITKKIRKAFFLVFASAFSLLAAMLPVFFSGINTLTGFAITTILGVLVGVLITRQAFADMVREIL